MANQQRDLAREQQWRELVTAWQSSGQSVRAFCSQRQVREANFYAWRRELRLRDAELGAVTPREFETQWQPSPTASTTPTTWAEDRAPVGTDSSADPGANTDPGGTTPPSSDRFGTQAINPSLLMRLLKKRIPMVQL